MSRIALLGALLLALPACDPGAEEDAPDMPPGRCDAYCAQLDACGVATTADCLARCDDFTDACLSCGTGSSCANIEAGACNTECGEDMMGGPRASLGADCNVNSQCQSAFCQTEQGTADGTCALNDLAQNCADASTCAYDVCLTENATPTCSKACEDFADCPSFYTCVPVDGRAGNYCVLDD